MNIIYTVCNRTNLTHALTLAESASQHQPDHLFYLCWVDSLPVTALPTHIKQLSVSEVNIPQWENMTKHYTDFELLAACRPWFALELLRRHADCVQIAFFSPTVLLFRSFNEALNTDSAIFLTPNIVEPLTKSKLLDDKRILNIGMFHSGSWVLMVNKKTTEVLQWWAERTADRAKFDLCEGMNLDQLWLNYVPIWITETTIIRHAGWHYGLHAVLNKNLTFKSDKYLVDDMPLISIDFAGLDYFDPVWSDHAALLSGNQAFLNLFRKYKLGLEKHKSHLPESSAPGFGEFVKIRKFRILRNNMARKLASITQYIDQF